MGEGHRLTGGGGHLQRLEGIAGVGGGGEGDHLAGNGLSGAGDDLAAEGTLDGDGTAGGAGAAVGTAGRTTGGAAAVIAAVGTAGAVIGTIGTIVRAAGGAALIHGGIGGLGVVGANYLHAGGLFHGKMGAVVCGDGAQGEGAVIRQHAGLGGDIDGEGVAFLLVGGVDTGQGVQAAVRGKVVGSAVVGEGKSGLDDLAVRGYAGEAHFLAGGLLRGGLQPQATG